MVGKNKPLVKAETPGPTHTFSRVVTTVEKDRWELTRDWVEALIMRELGFTQAPSREWSFNWVTEVEDLEKLVITRERETTQRGEPVVSYNVKRTYCPKCEGEMKADGSKCSNCSGTGQLTGGVPELIRTREGDQRLPDET